MALVIETRIAGRVVAPLQLGTVTIYATPGIPIGATGVNNDLHIDTDGAKASFRPTIYQKQAGAWVAVA